MDNARPDSADRRVSTEVAPRTGRTLAIAAAALAAILVVGFAVAFGVRHRAESFAERSTDQGKDAPADVEVVEVRPTPAHYPLELPGQTAGWYQSPLYARVDGYVHDWSANIGDAVKQGQVLATIDTPELDQQLAAARAKAVASAAQIKVAEANESIAKSTHERWRDSKPGVVSVQEQQQKQADYDSAVAHLAAAHAQAMLDDAEVRRYSAMSGFRQVMAPYDGVITSRDCDIGKLVTAGSGGNTRPLYTMAKFDTIRVLVDMPQKAVLETTVGLHARVRSDLIPDQDFLGAVAFTARSIDPRTRTEQVEVDIPNPDLRLVPGMYVRVTFELAEHGLMQVPAAAIVFKPGGLQVAVVGSDGKVDFRPIVVAKDNGDFLELSGGVSPGDKVALNISSAVVPGQLVKAVESDKAATPPPSGPNTARLDKPGGGMGGD